MEQLAEAISQLWQIVDTTTRGYFEELVVVGALAFERMRRVFSALLVGIAAAVARALDELSDIVEDLDFDFDDDDGDGDDPDPGEEAPRPASLHEVTAVGKDAA